MLGFLFGNYANVYAPPLIPATPVQPVVTGQLAMLQQRLDTLELACAGLWRVLKAKHGYSDEELIAAIHEIDAADGTVDGKITPVSGVCPHCKNRILSRTAGKCLWCGAPLSMNPLTQSDNGL